MTTKVANVGLLLLVSGLVAEPASTDPGDVEGGKDLPIVSRYPGSVINSFDNKAFDEIDLITGGPACDCDGQKITTCKTQHLEGKVSWVSYDSPTGRSVLEIYRNYEQALQKAGFQPIYSCTGEECGSDCGRLRNQLDYIGGWNNRYLVAKLSRSTGDVWAAVNVSDYGPRNNVLTVEMKPMQAGMVTVSAADLAGDLAKTGHIALYGIYFDTGKADVKAESEPALAEVAKLLKQQPAIKLIVAGHTDNVGDFASNMDLSKRRAQAVVQALSTKYPAAASRLNPQGLGQCAPVASNDDEAGRARNRRVELVKQ
jgi:OOP family OmpA-OmpF porin